MTSYEKALLSWIDYGYYMLPISLDQFSLELMFEYHKTKTNTFSPQASNTVSRCEFYHRNDGSSHRLQ